jgi:phosphate acyltransferase
MRIGVDIMGGDYAPLATVKGSFLALEQVDSDIELVLFGNSESIIRIAGENNFDIKRKHIEIVHCTETIDMDEQPYKAFTQKN